MDKNKIINRTDIGHLISEQKSKGMKVVFTNGCFDILHIGHVRYLSQAKALGDILVVGLNSDSSVSAIKPGRPVINEDQRAEVLAALSAVDYVVLFNEDTPYELIKDVKPDLLIKGADWNKEDIVGSDLVKDVQTIKFVDGISTSEIINKIQSLK